MPDYMNEFNDDFEYKDLPDETTLDDAEHANIALKNTRLLKQYIENVEDKANNIESKANDIESKTEMEYGTNEAGVNYFKFANGLLLYWGTVKFPAGVAGFSTTETQVDFLTAYKDTSYSCSILFNAASNGFADYSVYCNKSTSSVDIGGYNRSSAQRPVDAFVSWFTIGFWK